MQQRWLEWEAQRRFDGELSRTLRWALEQGRAFGQLMAQDDPVEALDRVLNPEKYPPEEIDDRSEAEIAAARMRRERAIARAFGLEDEG